MRIREMTNDDLSAVALLSDQLGYPVTLPQLEPRFDHLSRSGDEALLVAELADGTVAGWIHVGPDLSLIHDGVAEIKGLVVGSEHRGHGLGGELAGAAESWCMRRGFRTVRVRTRIEREEAFAFYQRRGYREQKRQHVLVKKLS